MQVLIRSPCYWELMTILVVEDCLESHRKCIQKDKSNPSPARTGPSEPAGWNPQCEPFRRGDSASCPPHRAGAARRVDSFANATRRSRRRILRFSGGFKLEPATLRFRLEKTRTSSPFFSFIGWDSNKMVVALINANPTVYEKKERRPRNLPSVVDEYAEEPIDQQEIFDHVRDIKDPEYPYSLEELNVVTEDSIEVDDKQSYVRVTFTPTVEHCSMATIIGLCLHIKLMRSLPSRYKVVVRVAPGTHQTEASLNKQLNDKERVAAAMESPSIMGLVDSCLEPTFA